MTRLWPVCSSVALVAIVASCSDLTTRPRGAEPGAPAVLGVGLNANKTASRAAYADGGCAVAKVQPNGTTRAYVLQHQELPFAVRAIQYDPKTKIGNGRVSHLTMTKSNGSVISLT